MSPTSPIFFLLFLAFLSNGVRAKSESKSKSNALEDEASRGGPFSQQYHYSSYGGAGGGQEAYGGHGGGGIGIGLDTNTLLYLVIGCILVLLLFTVFVPLLNGGGNSGGSGWGRRSFKLYNIAGMAEKVLTGIEKFYDTYKDQ